MNISKRPREEYVEKMFHTRDKRDVMARPRQASVGHYSREKWKLVSGVVISCSGNLSAIQPASGYIALSNSSFRPSPRLISTQDSLLG